MRTNRTYDQLVNTDSRTVIETAFGLLSKLQDRKPGERVVAPALMLVLVAERFGVSAHDAITVAHKIVQHDEKYEQGAQLRAFRDYLNNEMGG